MFIYLLTSVDEYHSCLYTSFTGNSLSTVLLVWSAIRTEARPPVLPPSQPCRSSGLLPRKPAAVENGSVEKSGLADTDSRSLSAVGRSTSATVLPAGDLLLGPCHSGQSAERLAVITVATPTIHNYNY